MFLLEYKIFLFTNSMLRFHHCLFFQLSDLNEVHTDVFQIIILFVLFFRSRWGPVPVLHASAPWLWHNGEANQAAGQLLPGGDPKDGCLPVRGRHQAWQVPAASEQVYTPSFYLLNGFYPFYILSVFGIKWRLNSVLAGRRKNNLLLQNILNTHHILRAKNIVKDFCLFNLLPWWGRHMLLKNV